MLPNIDPNKLTIENIRDKLNNRFERIEKNKTAREEEKALYAFKKQYKGRCGKCGEYGHKRENCTENRKGNSSFNGHCYYCGEKGHIKSNCEVKQKGDALKNKDVDEQARFGIDEVSVDEDGEESVGSFIGF